MVYKDESKDAYASLPCMWYVCFRYCLIIVRDVLSFHFHYIVSPTRQCPKCVVPPGESYRPSFGDWLTHSFFASMWLPKRMLFYSRPSTY
jgi:hypothetical protein